MKKLLKTHCLKTASCRGYYIFFKFQFSQFSPSNFPHFNCPPSAIIKHTLVHYCFIRNLMSSNDPHTHAFVFQHPSPFFILKSVFFSLVSKLSLKERRRKIINDRVLMIEDMINLQNKAMKTNVKVKFLYAFTHAQGMLEFFSRKKKPNKPLKLYPFHWSYPGCCGYDVALAKQG